MEEERVEINSVDPELKAHITRLVSALGGPDLTEASRPYVLGDEALACLRDIKKWIKGYDERMNRWDIARAISETSLVSFDLLEILARWEADNEAQTNTKMGDRIALACLELLVPLTWPIVLDAQSTNNHYRHAPALLQAQLRYKRAVLGHPKQVLKAVIRLAIPILKMDKTERTTRDEGIMKLVLFFFRNILAIEPDATEGQRIEDDVSRSNTLYVFDEQRVVPFIVTIASEIGDSFTLQDIAVMECMFHMLRGLEPHDFFPSPQGEEQEDQSQKAPSSLKGILTQEKEMKTAARRGAPNRHSRFGTMVSMVNSTGNRYAVSGVDGLLGMDSTLSKLDRNKKWSKPSRRRAGPGEVWNQHVPLSRDSITLVQNFVRDVLKSAFNPLFGSVRRLIETENERASVENQMQFLYLVGFFLECERRKHDIELAELAEGGGEEESDYGLVANVLNQNMFIVVMKAMREASDRGPRQNFGVVYSSMVCFLQILLIVQQMSQSLNKEDQEIAENMKQRLFYEEQYLTVLAQLPRMALRQSQFFLNKSIELTSVLIKMLEGYSKQHTTIFVRARKKRVVGQAGEEEAGEFDDDDAVDESRRVTSERKFEFARFEAKYFNTEAMDAIKRYLANYKELSSAEIMIGLKFVHRLFAYKETRASFYSLDFMRLLQRMTDSASGISKTFKARKEVDRFMAYYTNKLRNALEKNSSLFVELLFNKMSDSLFFLEHGYENPKPAKKNGGASGVAKPWDFVDQDKLTNEQQHAILIAVMIDDGKTELIEWLVDEMTRIVKKRVVEVGNDERLTGEPDKLKSTKQDGKFRVLLGLLGFTLPEAMDETCFMPRFVEMEKLELGLQYLKKYLFEPFQLEEQPDQAAGDFLKRRVKVPAKKRKRAAKGSGEEVGVDSDVVMADGPEVPELPDDDDDDDERQPRSTNKLKPELTKQYISADFIDSDDDLSDDERDQDFFQSEAKILESIRSTLNADLQRNNKTAAESIFSQDKLSTAKWERPENDDQVPSPTQTQKVHDDGDSLFVGGDPVDSDTDDVPVKRARRTIAIDDDDE